jgi:hypothetical protein
MFGYHKKLVRVDLTNRRLEVEDLDGWPSQFHYLRVSMQRGSPYRNGARFTQKQGGIDRDKRYLLDAHGFFKVSFNALTVCA